MNALLIALKERTVGITFKHILTGIELHKNVTLCPDLVPRGISVGVSANSNKIPVWDMDHRKWMDIETSTIIKWT